MEELSICRSRQELLRAALTLAPELTRYLVRNGAAASEAQDLMQDVCIRILKIKNMPDIERPRAYLYKVATCVAYEHRQRGSTSLPHVAYDDATEEAASSSPLFEPNAPESAATITERLETLARRLNQLSPRVRDTLLWHYRDGYTCDEIAERLSAATHRVKKYLVKGLVHCRGKARM